MEGRKWNFAELLIYARYFIAIVSFNFYNNLVKFTDEKTEAQRS